MSKQIEKIITVVAQSGCGQVDEVVYTPNGSEEMVVIHFISIPKEVLEQLLSLGEIKEIRAHKDERLDRTIVCVDLKPKG